MCGECYTLALSKYFFPFAGHLAFLWDTLNSCRKAKAIAYIPSVSKAKVDIGVTGQLLQPWALSRSSCCFLDRGGITLEALSRLYQCSSLRHSFASLVGSKFLHPTKCFQLWCSQTDVLHLNAPFVRGIDLLIMCLGTQDPTIRSFSACSMGLLGISDCPPWPYQWSLTSTQ